MKSNKIIHLLFLIICAAILLIPVVFFNFSDISNEEKRNFEKFPLFFSEEKFNQNFFTELNSYFEDRIGLKRLFSRIYNTLDSKFPMSDVTKKSGYQGKKNWLFYNEENLFDFYFKRNLMTEEALDRYTEKLTSIRDWCETQGIKFIFFIAPNKHEIYEEYFPYHRPEGETVTNQIVNRLKKANICVIYPKANILHKKEETKKILYYERDTHWNNLGAYYGAQPLIDSIQQQFSEIKYDTISYKFQEEKIFGGDIENIISAPKRAMTQFVYDCYLNGIKQDSLFTCNTTDRNHIITWSKSTYPKLLMYRDSFATALYQFLAPYFSTSEFLWQDLRNSEKEFILQEKPDLLILEVAERKVTYLLGSDFER